MRRHSTRERRRAFLLAVVCAISAATPHVRAQTAVTLTASASPTSGQPNVHNIVITGSNFPAGTIVPADIMVTLQPQTTGAGPSASTAAKSVAIGTGTIRRITFTIPAEVVVVTPTAYHVSVTGRTTAGATFSSSNRANLTVNPPAKIVSVTPPGGAPGASLSVAITTQYTNFVQGATQASFGPGISVGGAAEGAFGPVTVHNPTSATAQIAIGQAAPPNARAITVRTGVQSATLSDAFTVATSNRAPTANAGGPYNGVAGQAIGFTATATDPDNDALIFTWNFGDQTDPVIGSTPTHAYAAPGDYSVSLTVSDGRGGSVTVSTTAAVAARPNIAPAFTSTPLTSAKHQLPYSYQAVATDPDGDALAFSV